MVIIGAGVAGLATGYRLSKAGLHDFLLLDVEKQPGGNATSGGNAVSAYPWGAHYVPLLTAEATAVRQLFEELGVITGQDAHGLPIYHEYYLCADPRERLHLHGRWQDGLVPTIGLTADEEGQYKRFFALMESLKSRTGKDGKRLFAIPLEHISQDPDWLALDGMTLAEWMEREGFTSPHLRWYADYCCRDDFGIAYTETSAWAGLHYYASRNGKAANAEPATILTWPEGNGWLVNQLAEPIQANIATLALAYAVTEDGDRVTVDYWDETTRQSRRITAQAAVIAVPRLVASRLLKSNKISAEAFSYSPWAVANITLSRLPEGKGMPLSWDNVVYRSPLLGYVVATHQITQMQPVKTVITYYWPLSHRSPAEARKEALARPYEEWQQIILGELLHIHPELDGQVERMDLWLWGHAMVRPTRGFIWGEARKRALTQYPPIFTPHSDMSGISLFEEAYTHGVRAAEGVLAHLGLPYYSVL